MRALMSGRFAHLTRCLDLQEGDVTDALASRDTTKALLAHLVAISAPNTGVAKVLIVFARMATTACDWIDGDLCIDVFAKADATVVEAATELGGGLRERVFAPMSFRAPFAEFTRAIDRVKQMLAPLVIRAKSPRRIALSGAASSRASAAPPPIEIATENLFVHSLPPVTREPADAAPPVSQPDDIDSGWED